jgi:hypothetical protein
VPCANQQNQCTNPPSSGTGGEALRIQNARNDAAQGLQWLQNLESLYNNIANLFSGQLADIVGKILGLKVGLEYLHTYTEELVNLVRGQVSWKDSMWTSENVANLQLQVELVAAKWMAEANLVGSLFVVAAVAIPFLDIAIGTVAIAYGTFQAGAAVDVAAAQASIDQEQWSLAGF